MFSGPVLAKDRAEYSGLVDGMLEGLAGPYVEKHMAVFHMIAEVCWDGFCEEYPQYRDKLDKLISDDVVWDFFTYLRDHNLLVG